MFEAATEVAGIVADPAKIFLARARIDDEKIILRAKAMHDHVVDECSIRIEERRVLRLAHGQLRGVVHRNVLDGGEGLRAGEQNVAHVTDVKNTNTRADRDVLVDDAAANRGRIFNGHIPAVEIDHLRAHVAMDAVERGLAHVLGQIEWRTGGRSGQADLDTCDSDSGWAAATWNCLS